MRCGGISPSFEPSNFSGYSSCQPRSCCHHSSIRAAIGLERAVLGGQLRQDPLAVADDRDVRGHVLGDLGRVDVDVDELRPRRELGQLAGDAVVEASADRDDQVGVVHRVVRGARAVHAEHPEPLVVRRRERAQPHQRCR